ncbi:MAG: hypothetical protein AB8H03_01435, partial [Saprospiraceae bacterium]
VIYEKLPITIKLIAIAVTAILTLIIIGSFEGGIRKLYPFWIRQILNWFFDSEPEDKKPKSIRVVLFVMLFIMLVPLVIGTTISSWKASPDLVAFTSAPPTVVDLKKVSLELNSSTQQILQEFEKDMNRDSIIFQKKLVAEKSKWIAKINEQKAKRKSFLRKHDRGHIWAKSHADKIKDKVIPNLNSLMQSSLLDIQNEWNQSLDSLRTTKKTTLLNEQKNKNQVMKSTLASNNNAIQNSKINIEKWGGFLAVLAIIATFFTMFCLSFIEAYKAGILPSGIGIIPPITPQTPKRKWEFWKNNYPDTTQDLIASSPPLSVSHTQAETFVPQKKQSNQTSDTQSNTQLHHTQNYEMVSIDNLIKRTRQQYARSKDTTRPTETIENNRRKAEKNINFLRSIGVKVEFDLENEKKLIIDRREIA